MTDKDDITKIIGEDPGFKEGVECPPIIKVVGVGGGGNNAINHMYKQDVPGVSFVVCNTDRQALNSSPVPTRLLIGPNTTKGLGAGNDPEKARKAAEESRDEIAQLFNDGTQMVFITAGMGGGTGTGAGPVVARIAREQGVLTIGIVTIPFLFEGRKKIIKALNGADEMSKYVDAILVINNERLTDIYPELDMMTGFGKADDTLSTAARSISDMINASGIINLDFNDVNSTLRDGGVAIISSGFASGPQRVTKAIENALHSPLLRNRDVYGSKKLLMNFYYNLESDKPLKMEEMGEVNDFTCNLDNVDCIWGLAADPTLEGDQIKVTILASGFNLSLESEAPAPTTAPATPQETPAPTRPQPAEPKKPDNHYDQRLEEEYSAAKLNQQMLNRARSQYIVLRPEDIDNDDLLDIFESNPTYGRDQKVRAQVRGLQESYKQQAQPIAEPQPQAESTTQSTPNRRIIKFG